MKPRNVRPCWIEVSADHRPSRGTGPRGRSGELSAVLSLRVAGEVVRAIDFECIGSKDGTTTLVRITDRRNGKVLHEERVTQ